MSYNRNTELRHVNTKDLYRLAIILDNDNQWQTLMEIIPQEINNQTFGTAEDLERISSGVGYKRKYNNDHIRLIENAIRRPGESRLYSQILFDEWSSSGRRHERPTLGVLLHLLVQSKIYRAADFLAEILNEPKPPRPKNGPAAEFGFEVDVFNDIEEIVNDTRFYPNTDDLKDNFNIDINKDYYTKYHTTVDKKIPTVNDNTEEPTTTTAPKPPPRLHKSARLIKQQQQMLQQQHVLQRTACENNDIKINFIEYSKQEEHFCSQLNNERVSEFSLGSSKNMPQLSALLHTKTNSETISSATESETATTSTNNLTSSEPQLSTINNSSESPLQEHVEEDKSDCLNSTPSLIYSKPHITKDHDLNSIPILVLNKTLKTDCMSEGLEAESYKNLPALSSLNLNGEKDDDEPSDVLEFVHHRRDNFEECAVTDDDLNIPYIENLSTHQLEAIDEDYSGNEHEHDNDVEVELDDDEDSIPNLSFLDNRSSNNESSLTSVTNTSGENSFEQSVNDCSSTSADNIPFLSVLNQ